MSASAFRLFFLTFVMLAGVACAQDVVGKNSGVPEWPSGPKTRETRLAELSYFLDNYEYSLSKSQLVPESQCQGVLDSLNDKDFKIIEPDLRTDNPEIFFEHEVFKKCPELKTKGNWIIKNMEIYNLSPYVANRIGSDYIVYKEAGGPASYIPNYPYMMCDENNNNCMRSSHGNGISTYERPEKTSCSTGFYPPLALDFIYQGHGKFQRKHGVYGLGLFGGKLYHFVIPEEYMTRPVAEIAQTANAAFIDVQESFSPGGEVGCYFTAKKIDK